MCRMNIMYITLFSNSTAEMIERETTTMHKKEWPRNIVGPADAIRDHQSSGHRSSFFWDLDDCGVKNIASLKRDLIFSLFFGKGANFVLTSLTPLLEKETHQISLSSPIFLGVCWSPIFVDVKTLLGTACVMVTVTGEAETTRQKVGHSDGDRRFSTKATRRKRHFLSEVFPLSVDEVSLIWNLRDGRREISLSLSLSPR